ncbi:sensor domain-containing diguanylate cyclase [Shewanella marinintestina]|uniref:sensor domain-containing diguanylate cyclase n=1 Tax=Shewanella marinintestina TaxID=190305 RepID=UPI00200D90F4|nr:diguanylate cyclase [Shewanella marinintestina]MCL1145376.1 sensor domain-containing diguanylate cyclase [Shewanella marinintestina]
MLNKFFVFLFLMIMILITNFIVYSLDRVKDEKRLFLVVAELNKVMASIFNGALISSEVLKEMVEVSDENNLTSKKFDRISKDLLKSHKNVDSILLLPNGVVTYVYPYEDNKKAIGHDVLSDPNRKLGSMEAILKSEVSVIGPVSLIQNDKQAFIVRRVIRNGTEFWGLTSSIVYLESILSSIDTVIKDYDIDSYHISGYNPDSKAPCEKIITSKGIIEGRELSAVVGVFNTKWEISVSKSKSEPYIKIFIFLSLLVLFLLFLSPSFRYFKKYKGSEKEKLILENEAHTDYLTGLPNRRGFEHQIRSFHHSDNFGSVAIFDIDFFKKINDTYGHDVGDGVLVGFANFCRKHVPDRFVLSRSGGEEFILLMPLTKIEDAKAQCEQLKVLISNEKIAVDSLVLNLTMSVGVSYFEHTKEIKAALTLADKALYRAKQGGRDRVCVN